MKIFFSNTFKSLHKAFNKRPFAAFLTASTSLHLLLLLAVPSGSSINHNNPPELFDVKLIPLPDLHLKKNLMQSRGQDAPNKYADSNRNISSELDREATVSLYPDDKKHAKYESYLSHLRHKIDSTWQYPAIAKESCLEGKLTLCFSIKKNGSLINVDLTSPSRHIILNHGALRAIRDSAPFNPFPKKFSITKLNVLATFNYQFSSD